MFLQQPAVCKSDRIDDNPTTLRPWSNDPDIVAPNIPHAYVWNQVRFYMCKYFYSSKYASISSPSHRQSSLLWRGTTLLSNGHLLEKNGLERIYKIPVAWVSLVSAKSARLVTCTVWKVQVQSFFFSYLFIKISLRNCDN